MRPSAIFPQKARSRSLRTGGRPGERITARPVNAAAHPGGRPIENTSIVEVLRPPVEPGQQYTAIHYSETLMLEGLIPSIGTVGDALDNGLCETTIGLYKTECVREGSPFRTGPIRTLTDLENSTSAWVAWYNERRLMHRLRRRPPAEAEAEYYARLHAGKHTGHT